MRAHTHKAAQNHFPPAPLDATRLIKDRKKDTANYRGRLYFSLWLGLFPLRSQESDAALLIAFQCARGEARLFVQGKALLVEISAKDLKGKGDPIHQAVDFCV